MKFVYVFFTVAVLVAACSQNDSAMPDYFSENQMGAGSDYKMEEYNSDAAYEVEEESFNNSNQGDAGAEGLNQQLSFNRKLIKNASMSFETDSLSQRKGIIKRAVKRYGAYVEHEEQYYSGGRETVTTTLRIPTLSFDDFMDDITRGVGSYDSKTIEVDDVTEEYVDIQARINTKKELKTRFIKLLDKAETIVKIMEIEREITALQSEIESYEGRLKYLSGSVKFATVNLTYYQIDEAPPTEIVKINKFEQAFSRGWEGIVVFCLVLVHIWPFIIMGTIVLIVIRRRFKNKKKAQKQVS